MKIMVSRIKSRPLRRIAIAASYPLLAVAGIPLAVAWNAVLDVIIWQIELARTAAQEWKK